jgi:hypothetical protein
MQLKCSCGKVYTDLAAFQHHHNLCDDVIIVKEVINVDGDDAVIDVDVNVDVDDDTVKVPPKKKNKVQSTLFGHFKSYRNPNAAPSTTKALPALYQCPGCQRPHKSSQALGNHRNHCSIFKQMMVTQQDSTTAAPAELPTTKSTVKLDGRNKNCGSLKRDNYSYQDKFRMVEEYNTWKEVSDLIGNESSLKTFTVITYGRKNCLKYQCLIGRWRQKDQWKNIVKLASDAEFSSFKKPPRVCRAKCFFPDMERHLFKLVETKRKRKQKVSKKYVQINALKEFRKRYPSKDVSEFKVSFFCPCFYLYFFLN